MQDLPSGVWVDRNGDLHFSVPDILRDMGLPVTPENQQMVQQVLMNILRKHVPGSQIVERTVDDLPGKDPANDPLRP